MTDAWYAKAKCKGWPLDLFTLEHLDHPRYHSRAARNHIAACLCDGCPVMQACAADAVYHRDCGIIRAGTWLQPHPTAETLGRLNAIAAGEFIPTATTNQKGPAHAEISAASH